MNILAQDEKYEGQVENTILVHQDLVAVSDFNQEDVVNQTYVVG